MVRFITDHGRTIDLGKRLGEGGEGVVYEVTGMPLVAKLLFAPADPQDLARRLASLMRLRLSARMPRLLGGEQPRVAWPVETGRGLSSRPSADPVPGFLIPDMRQWFRPLSVLLQPGPRSTWFPSATWDTSLAAAASLAGLIADLHEAGFVVGDLKPANLWVNGAGDIGISDIDSFQFADGIGTFPCLSRTPDYTAPELISDGNALPSPSADDFVLAVLIYQLLMDGMHPFSGIPADGTRYISIDDNITHGRARVARPDAVLAMPGAPPLWALPKRLRRGLFDRCFRDVGSTGVADRPAALDWVDALMAERAPERLRTCRADPRHRHTVERPWCPWCDAAQLSRLIPKTGIYYTFWHSSIRGKRRALTFAQRVRYGLIDSGASGLWERGVGGCLLLL